MFAATIGERDISSGRTMVSELKKSSLLEQLTPRRWKFNCSAANV